MFSMLRREIEIDLALLGRQSVAEVDASVLTEGRRA
jgi:hypothetical protein